MEIRHIASGSKGNAFQINRGTETIQIDCGVKTEVPDHLLLTHLHKDHTKYFMDMILAGVKWWAPYDCGKRGWVCFHFNPGKKHLIDNTWWNSGIPNGWPDLTILIGDGRTIFIETKIKPNKPSKNQIKMLKILRSKGFICEIIYNIDEWKNLLMDKMLP